MTMTITRPMLAATVQDIETINYPVLVSPKLDGIRCLMKNGVAMSRSGKSLPNLHIQRWAKKWDEHFHGLDGELIVGEPTAHDCIQVTTSGVMSQDGEPNFRYWVFDAWLYPQMPFNMRYRTALNAVRGAGVEATVVPQYPCANSQELKAFMTAFINQGYEGMIIRDPEGRYKNGRSTLKEGLLLKLKPWEDSEAEILGYYELMVNENEAEINELGYTNRPKRKAGMVPGGTLGGLHVRDIHNPDWVFDIGSGLARSQRDALWSIRDQLGGLIVKYKYFPIGVKDAPRQPILIGFRTELDL